MNDTLGQLLSLVAYGTEYITQGKLNGDYNKNSVFKNCRSVFFMIEKRSLWGRRQTIIAGVNPLDWFKYLKQNNCRELKIIYTPSNKQQPFKDFVMSGLGAGGTWFIEAIHKNYSDFWYAWWDINEVEDVTERGWKVTYKRIASKKQTINLKPLLYPTKDKLIESLSQIKQFAYEQKEYTWVDYFTKAIETLNSNNPSSYFYYPDLVPLKNYDLIAQQLIFGAANSWAFGGMGSWNDLAFTDKTVAKKYETLSEKLYENMINAFITGVNSF